MTWAMTRCGSHTASSGDFHQMYHRASSFNISRLSFGMTRPFD
jgi:hypothetical protein